MTLDLQDRTRRAIADANLMDINVSVSLQVEQVILLEQIAASLASACEKLDTLIAVVNKPPTMIVPPGFENANLSPGNIIPVKKTP